MADVEFIDNHLQVNRAIDDAVGAFLLEAAAELVSATRRNTPVDQGQLKGSFAANVDESKGEAVVGSPLENAIWTELGTGEWAAKRNGRAGAWYVPVEKVTGKKKPTFNGQVIIVYGKNGQQFYKTNGKKPVHMLQKAFDTNKGKFIRRAEEIFKARFDD